MHVSRHPFFFADEREQSKDVYIYMLFPIVLDSVYQHVNCIPEFDSDDNNWITSRERRNFHNCIINSVSSFGNQRVFTLQRFLLSLGSL